MRQGAESKTKTKRMEKMKESTLQKKHTEKYARNWDIAKMIVAESFCDLALFLENAVDMYGVDGFISRLYACDDKKAVEKLVFTLL